MSPIQKIIRAHEFRERSGGLQGALSERSASVQRAFRKRSGDRSGGPSIELPIERAPESPRETDGSDVDEVTRSRP